MADDKLLRYLELPSSELGLDEDLSDDGGLFYLLLMFIYKMLTFNHHFRLQEH
jgi:hypothetical protein